MPAPWATAWSLLTTRSLALQTPAASWCAGGHAGGRSAKTCVDIWVLSAGGERARDYIMSKLVHAPSQPSRPSTTRSPSAGRRSTSASSSRWPTCTTQSVCRTRARRTPCCAPACRPSACLSFPTVCAPRDGPLGAVAGARAAPLDLFLLGQSRTSSGPEAIRLQGSWVINRTTVVRCGCAPTHTLQPQP